MASDSRLRALRDQLGMSQQEVADASGLARNYVSLLETAAQVPSLTTLHQLSRALGVPLHELLHLDDEAAKPVSPPERLGREVAALARRASPKEVARLRRILRAFFKSD